MQKVTSFNNVAIVYVKGSAYRIHFWRMSKDDTINIMSDSNLVDKMINIKMSECNSVDLIYYQRNRNVILNRVKDYYENDKERLRQQTRDKYRNLSEEGKNIKKEYGKKKIPQMSEEKKQRLKEYQNNFLICIIIIDKIVFELWFNSACYLFSHTLLNPCLRHLDKLTEIKSCILQTSFA